MYVYMKAEGKFVNNEFVGVGKFECNVFLTVPKEVFEEKLQKKKSFEVNDHVIKIDQIEKLEYNDGTMSQNEYYILPLGAQVKKKTVLQKIKTLYFG